jgi:hypothetical protein
VQDAHGRRMRRAISRRVVDGGAPARRRNIVKVEEREGEEKIDRRCMELDLKTPIALRLRHADLLEHDEAKGEV